MGAAATSGVAAGADPDSSGAADASITSYSWTLADVAARANNIPLPSSPIKII